MPSIKRIGALLIVVVAISVLMASGCIDAEAYIDDYVFNPDASDLCGAVAVSLVPDSEILYDFKTQEYVIYVNGDLVPFPETPGDSGFAYADFSVSSDSGNEVQGWFIPSVITPATGTVMLNHGSRGTRACFLSWATWLAQAGYHVVVYDYEGFDDSGGQKSVANIVPDARAVFQWIIQSDDPARQTVVLFGISLGTGPAITLADEYSERVPAVVLDSPFVVPSADRIDIEGITGLFVPGILEAFPDDMDNAANIKSVQAPILFLQGTLDTVSLIGDSQKLFQMAPAGSEWVEFESEHVAALFVDPQRYQDEVLSFLGRQITRRLTEWGTKPCTIEPMAALLAGGG